MDAGNFLASISIIAILALVGTTLILLFELRHLFFHKKVTTSPEIPDFDGNIHMAPEHATLIDIDTIEHGGVNKTLVIVLLAIIAVLAIIVISGLLYGDKKTTSTKPAVQVPTAVPAEIIDIKRVSPTSPFKEVVEIPFDLSGTPAQVLRISPTDTAKGGALVATATLAATHSAQATTVVANPSLPASGGFSHFVLLAIVPFLLVALALVL